MSFSGGSNPRAIAGSESVTKLTHKSCTASKGDSIPNNSPINIVTISPIFVAIKNELLFYIVKYISSLFNSFYYCYKVIIINIISDAFLATSVPFLPIATPISAFFNAGASFTPSPVIATTEPVA